MPSRRALLQRASLALGSAAGSALLGCTKKSPQQTTPPAATGGQASTAQRPSGAVASPPAARTQAAAGAIAPVPTVYNALDYGVKWNGSADDSRALQQLEDQVSAAGGGVIVLPGGTGFANVTKRSRVHWRGAGYEATVLRGAVEGAGLQQLKGSNSTDGIFGWSIADMTIDGNGGPGGLHVYGYGYALTNLRIRNCSGDGFYTEWSASAASPGQDAMEAQVSGLKVHDCGGMGLNFNGPHDSQFVNMVLYNCRTPLYIAPGDAAAAAQLTNVHVWNTNGGGTFSAIIAATACVLTNLVVEGGQIGQVQILGNDVKSRGLRVFNAGNPGTYGIQVGDDAHKVTGLDMDFDVYDCQRGALYLAGDGGSNRLIGQAYLSSGTNYLVGTMSDSTYCEMQQTGLHTGRNVLYGKGLQTTTFQNGTSDVINVNLGTSRLELVNGAALRGYSDMYRTQTFEISTAGYGDFGVAGLRTRYLSGSGAPPNGNDGDLVLRDDGIWVRAGGVWRVATFK